MRRLLISAGVLTLAFAGTARAAAPDPERALDTPVQTEAGSPWVGSDAKAMFTAIGKSGSRITTVDVEMVSGKPRYAIGYVSNRGVQRRRWWWDPKMSESALLARLKARNARLIDLDVYVVKGKRRLSAVSVENAGEAAKTWWWHPRVKLDDIIGLTEANGSRIVDLERGPGGVYDLVTIKNGGVDARAWWLLFNQQHSNIARAATDRNARIQDLEHTGQAYNFDLVLTQEERPRGWFFNTSDTATKAVSATRSFGARTSVVEYFTAPTGKRTLAHVGVTDVNPATEAARVRLLGDENRFDVDGTMGLLATSLTGPPLVALNANLKYETASAMKALHHAAVTHLYEQLNRPIDKAGDFMYRQYIGIPSCPLDNITSKPVVSRTLGQTAIDMLQSSDNGATAAVLSRLGGKPALLKYAKSLGLRSVRLGKPIGCFDRADPNLWTLRDAGRLYSAMASGRVATKEPYVTHLFSSFFDGSTALRDAWTSAANAIGRPDLAKHAPLVEWKAKGGDYANSSGRISTNGGILWLPVSKGATVGRRPYVLGAFYDSRSAGLPSSYKSTTLNLSPSAIAEALATFPPEPPA